MPCGVKRILATELHRFSQKEIFTFSVILLFGPEPFGNELPSGLSLRVEDKAELLTAEGCFLWP
jgi:hypothetical protein